MIKNLRLACGHDTPHALGQEIYNYYDMKRGYITALSTHCENDTSGMLPNGKAWWVDTTAGHLDGSRMICLSCANKKGWI